MIGFLPLSYGFASSGSLLDNGMESIGDITYVNKTGKVYSPSPGSAKFTSTTDEVTIKVTKTDGRAETQVNIYVNGVFTKKMEFDNGNYSNTTKTRTITGTKGKEVKVTIVNQSVGNTFSYRLVCTGKQECPSDLENTSGTVYAAGPKTFTLRPDCDRLVIEVEKTGGRAETQVNVYVDNVFKQKKKMEFDNGLNTKTERRTIFNAAGKTVKVEIVNQSVANTFKYKFKATQKDKP